MNEASAQRQPRDKAKLGLVLLSCVALGVGLAELVHPRGPSPALKKRPAETPTRQEPSRRPNSSLEPELVCGYVAQRPARLG